MMNIAFLLLHMLGAGMSGYTFYRLCETVDYFNPTSIRRRKQVWKLLMVIGVVCIVNLFFWVPDYYSVQFKEVVTTVVVLFRLIITLGLSYYVLDDYIPDLRQKYSLNFIVYKTPDSSMTPTGQLVSFAECEEMIERYRKDNPNAKENFFYDTDFVRNIIDTKGAKFLLLVPGKTTTGEDTMILFPANEDLTRIPMKPTGVFASRSSSEGDEGGEGDYGGDRAGTTPPGTKG